MNTTPINGSESSASHKNMAAVRGPVHLAIVTVSDSRTPENDSNGRYLRDQFAASGHLLAGYRIVPDESDQVEAVLEEFTQSEAQIVLFNGGTGISSRDRTYDVISLKLHKTLPGFGELFRLLSYEQVGPAAMFSRAIAGVYKGKVVISTPGSPAAVRLAWEKLILPEISHLAWEVSR